VVLRDLCMLDGVYLEKFTFTLLLVVEMRDHATQINNCWIGVHRNLEEERAKVSKKGQNKVSRPRRMQRKSGHRQRWRGTKTASLFSS
jgi:hypothetical protein